MISIVRLLIPFVAPLPMGLFFLLCGLVLLVLRKVRSATVSVAVGIGIILFFGYGIGTTAELYRLERQYQPLRVEQLSADQQKKIQYVVVLGSGHVSDPDIPLSAMIGGSSLYRLVEGIVLFRQLPGTKLVISGGACQDPVANAVIVSRLAEKLGVDHADLIVETRPADTAEEVKLLVPLVGKRSFVLVTSAAHMARAMALFRQAGSVPIPAPTDYILKNRKNPITDNFLPSCGNLGIAKRVIYEYLGTIWSMIKTDSVKKSSR